MLTIAQDRSPRKTTSARLAISWPPGTARVPRVPEPGPATGRRRPRSGSPAAGRAMAQLPSEGGRRRGPLDGAAVPFGTSARTPEPVASRPSEPGERQGDHATLMRQRHLARVHNQDRSFSPGASLGSPASGSPPAPWPAAWCLARHVGPLLWRWRHRALATAFLSTAAGLRGTGGASCCRARARPAGARAARGKKGSATWPTEDRPHARCSGPNAGVY
jgi:hypothetical protein